MLKLEVFDPPMCCSTGVCGPAVDPALPKFTADLDWLRSQGVQVERYNLAQQPAAFVGNDLVKRTLAEEGNNCLPLILVGNQIVSRSVYPRREELAAFVGLVLETPMSLYSPAVEKLVAIGASIACNCMPCLKYHTDKARSLGVSDEDMAKAVAMAQKVKQTPDRLILELANRYLNGKVQEAADPQASCSPSADSGSGSKCCG